LGVPCVWDEAKNAKNQRKHGVSFEEASALFDGRDYLEIFDIEHSDYEDRFLGIGPVNDDVLMVVYTERNGDEVRIISARRATKKEIALYQAHRAGQVS
jgi:uncharacterized DUF497 family protein